MRAGRLDASDPAKRQQKITVGGRDVAGVDGRQIVCFVLSQLLVVTKPALRTQRQTRIGAEAALSVRGLKDDDYAPTAIPAVLLYLLWRGNVSRASAWRTLGAMKISRRRSGGPAKACP